MAELGALVPTLGGLSWISGALFELEGRWAEEMGDPAATVHLAEHSRHHGSTYSHCVRQLLQRGSAKYSLRYFGRLIQRRASQRAERNIQREKCELLGCCPGPNKLLPLQALVEAA